MWRASALGAAVGASVLALTACNGGSGDDGGAPVTELGEPSAGDETNGETTDEEKVASALDRYLRIRDRSFRAGKVDPKRLEKVATDEAYIELQQMVHEHDSAGISISGEYAHTLKQPRLGGKSASVTVCEDAAAAKLTTSDGTEVTQSFNEHPLPDSRAITYQLRHEKGRWLVEQWEFEVAGNGKVKPC